ncbi:MAG TPA: hypothetical protein VGH37_12215 [Candidatus Acidoferrum sp.]|jgi:hypothetical protein
MKMSRLPLAIVGAALFFTTSAFAQNENKGKLSVPETITVEGKQLPPGDYKVEWQGAGPNVEVKILKGKETVATAPARLVQGQKKTAVDSFGATTQQDGTRVLSAIYFGGKTYSLEIAQNSAQNTSAADATTR